MSSPRFPRRTVLKGLFAAGAATLIGCGDDADSSPDATATSPSSSAPPTEGPGAPTSTNPPSNQPTATTQPAPTTQPVPIPEASLEAKVASMIMIGFQGLSLADLDRTAVALRESAVGHVVLFDRNVQSPQQLSQLNAAITEITATGKPLIAVDQEGGFVARLGPDKGFPETVSALYLGNRGLDVTTEYATSMAIALKAAGFNLNLAPVVDVNVNPESPAIGFYERSFSADPEEVAEHALAFIRAHHQQGVLTTLKHFAGHGSATTDSHLGITDVSNTWSRDELIPFRRVIEAGEADAIMTAHLINSQIDPEHPGTLSRATITGILREELGFDGVVITDDMQMGAIRQYYGFEHAIELAINAGADILAVANMLEYDPDLAFKTRDAVMLALQQGKLTEERIDQSYQRIHALKSRLS